MLLRRTIITGLFVIAAGCAKTAKISYDIGLVKVERPPAAEASYGEQRVYREGNADAYHFDDGLLEAEWTVDTEEIEVVLTNKTAQPMSIDWDAAQFIDGGGAAGGIIHSGVLLSDYEKAQEPTTIAPGASTLQMLTPKANIYYESGVYGSWRRRPLVSTDNPSSNVGKKMRIRLPLEVGSVTSTYDFIFEVGNVIEQ